LSGLSPRIGWSESAPPVDLRFAAITRKGARKSRVYCSDACDFWQFSEFRAARQLLRGEAEAITAETPLWHLDGFNATLVQDLFAVRFARPLALLLTALRADGYGLGAAREATRRRLGLGGAQRHERERRQKLGPTGAPDQNRPISAQACKDTYRFSLNRLIEGFPPPPAPVQPRATWPEMVAVYIVLGWGPKDGDILAPSGDWAPALLRNQVCCKHENWSPHNLKLTAAMHATLGSLGPLVLRQLPPERIGSNI
jgi:hypothetical protein